MKKSIIVSGVLALVLATSSFGASNDFDLKANMMKLNVELIEIQRGLMKGDQKRVEVTLKSFSTDVKDLLGDNGKNMIDISEEMKNKAHRLKMTQILPDNLKHIKHKVSVAMKSSRDIQAGIRSIRLALDNKDELSFKKRQAKAQEAYTDIVNSCFKCHNLVRDKKKK